MRVVHICTSDNSGGAARAAFRLHKGLRTLGVESFMFVRDRFTGDSDVIRYRKEAGLPGIANKTRKRLLDRDLKQYSGSRPAGLEVFSDDRSPLKSGFTAQLPSADIYNLHWVSGFADLPLFFRSTGRPVVWTMHDMFPFTGGCHYSAGCDRYLTSCGECPQLGSVSGHDLAYRIWRRKESSFKNFPGRLAFRADSYWLASEAGKSGLLRTYDIDTIHYGIETDIFIPGDRAACRKALNIPADAKVIAFGAPGLDNPRKGFAQLTGALQLARKKHPGLFLLCFGSGSLQAVNDIPVLNLGHILNNNLLSAVYNCADVFVIPSLQEAFGQTALEAMSCGIPVAGYDTGGIPDMVENGVTGFLAPTGDIEGLSEAVCRVLDLDAEGYGRMSAACRNRVLEGFTLRHQAQQYLELYNRLIKG